ncbi:MAG TPA: hypothetical protein DEQ04_04560, partial [Thermovirga lienii]|nr:hypothetical protein [Thermovirga lienii]
MRPRRVSISGSKFKRFVVFAVLFYVAVTRLFTPSYMAYAFRDVKPIAGPSNVEVMEVPQLYDEEGQLIQCDWDLVTLEEAQKHLDFLMRLGVCFVPIAEEGDDDD